MRYPSQYRRSACRSAEIGLPSHFAASNQTRMNSTSAHAKPLTDQQRLTLRHLVQHVARTFFDVEQIVALDQLAKHDVYVDC